LTVQALCHQGTVHLLTCTTTPPCDCLTTVFVHLMPWQHLGRDSATLQHLRNRNITENYCSCYGCSVSCPWHQIAISPAVTGYRSRG